MVLDLLRLRVAERPVRTDPPAGAHMLDLSGPHPRLVPLGGGLRADDVVPITLLDTSGEKPRLRVAYLPKDPPGLDLPAYYGAADSCVAAADFDVAGGVESLGPV